jgi:uncharacterized protein (TIGR02300 family)
MAKAKLGTKRSCTSCGLRYYDLNKTPITCPSCNAEFDPESLLKTRKSRQPVKATNDDEGSASEVEAAEGAAIDLDQNAADTSSADNDAIASDLDYDDDDDGDVDEDAGGLIQDDISAGDELLNNIPDSDDS